MIERNCLQCRQQFSFHESQLKYRNMADTRKSSSKVVPRPRQAQIAALASAILELHDTGELCIQTLNELKGML